MARTESEKEAMRRYRQKTVALSMQMFPSTESDIISRLNERAESGEPKASYVKRLIREDIERTNTKDGH